MPMRFLGASLMGLAAACMMAGNAVAAPVFPVSLTTIPSSPGVNQVTVFVSALGQSGGGTTNLSTAAPIAANVEIDGPYPIQGVTTSQILSIDLPASNFSIADTSFSIDLGFLGSLTASLVGVNFNIGPGGNFPVNPAGSGLINLTSQQGSLNGGVINYNVPIIGGGTFNFNTDPLVFAFSAAGSVNGAMTLSPKAAPHDYDLTLTVPINLTSELATSFGGIFATLTGNITLRGTVTVPEANSLVLLGLAGSGIGFVGIRRRRMSKIA